jgi:periplasmic protein CpxP/Spy
MCRSKHNLYDGNIKEIETNLIQSTRILTMMNKLAKLFPLLAIIVAVPAFAATQQFNHNDLQNSAAGKIAEGKKGDRLKELNLTPEQKTKMQAIWTSTRAQINEVLTPEQRQKLADSKGENRRGKWKSLNLTADQKAKMKAIRQSSQDQMSAILTTEQQAKWKTYRQGKKHNHN